jgi:hypothetical protein
VIVEKTRNVVVVSGGVQAKWCGLNRVVVVELPGDTQINVATMDECRDLQAALTRLLAELDADAAPKPSEVIARRGVDVTA